MGAPRRGQLASQILRGLSTLREIYLQRGSFEGAPCTSTPRRFQGSELQMLQVASCERASFHGREALKLYRMPCHHLKSMRLAFEYLSGLNAYFPPHGTALALGLNRDAF